MDNISFRCSSPWKITASVGDKETYFLSDVKWYVYLIFRSCDDLVIHLSIRTKICHLISFETPLVAFISHCFSAQFCNYQLKCAHGFKEMITV